MSAPYAELEHPLEDTALLCRGCLAESGEMKDIMEWGLTVDFFSVTGVQVDSTEGLSQLLCTTCEDALIKCKAFRSQCWNADIKLRELAKNKLQKPEPTSEEPPDEPTSEEHSNKDRDITLSCIMYDTQLVIIITTHNQDAKIYLSCPYNECSHRFHKKKDLLRHLVTYHNVNKDFKIDLQYYCAHKNCAYNVNSNSNKWFSCRKQLNQHYNKVHKFKCFHCEVCQRRFSTNTEFNSHLKVCNMTFSCSACDASYNTNEKLLVHLMRRHPDLHKQYKEQKQVNKRKSKMELETKKSKIEDYICDSPKRSSATQTLKPEENIKNDVTLLPWTKTDYKTDEISTQTVFEDLLSLKSQNSEDESIFFSETVSLSDIQTQTFPIEFGLSRSNKETLTSETQSPDLSIKETQTCYCLYDSPKVNYKLFDSVSSSPASINLTSTQTQTLDYKSSIKSDAWLGVNTTETQTCFEDDM